MIKFFKTLETGFAEIEQFENNCWVSVTGPNLEEREYLCQTLNVPEEFLEASLDEGESSHIEQEDGKTLVVVDVPMVEKTAQGSVYSTAPLGTVIMPDCIITISLRMSGVVKDFYEGRIEGVNTAYKTNFLLLLLLRMAERYLSLLKQIDKRSSKLEMQLKQSMKNSQLTQLMDLRNSLVFIQTSLKANSTTIEKLMRSKLIKYYEEDDELFEDVNIEMKQAIEMVTISLSIMSGTMDAFASIISNNLNTVMKVLACITVIMAIPTMVFSFYGMNIGAFAGSLPFAETVIVPLAIAFGLTLVTTLFFLIKGMFK